MKHWWERNSGVSLGEHTREGVEDVTGRIPLLLDKCVEGNKINLDAAFFLDIYSQATMYKYIKACLSRQCVLDSSSNFPNLVDHRYFYEEYTNNTFVANYTCGLARNAVAAVLREGGENFVDTNFLKSIYDNINNPSVAGFIIEQAILSSIGSNGLAIRDCINQPMTVVIFEAEFPEFRIDLTDTRVLYCPKKFNFRAIDGLIVAPKESQSPKKNGKTNTKTQQEKPKLFMAALQITIQTPETHSDSHEKFFNEWKGWTKGLEEFDIEVEFMWITPGPASSKDHLPKSQRPFHKERNVNFGEVNQDIWKHYQIAKEGQKNQKAPEELGVEEQIRAEEKGGAVEQAGAGIQETKSGGGLGEAEEQAGTNIQRREKKRSRGKGREKKRGAK